MKSKTLGLDLLYWQFVDLAINKEYVTTADFLGKFRINQERVNKVISELEKTNVIIKDGEKYKVIGFPTELNWREVSLTQPQGDEWYLNEKYTNVLTIEEGKTFVYQDFYNRGFTGKPEFLIDIHGDIAKYHPVSFGSVNERLRYAYLSAYWPRETIVAFHYDDEIKTLFIDVDLPEIEDTPVSNGERLKTAEEYYYDYARHVHAIALRVSAIGFMVCLEIESVIVAGYSQIFNHDTGDEDDLYLINVKLNRDKFERLPIKNISMCDPIQYLSGFDAIVKMDKNYKMNAINLKW
ncbi:TPA: hypothetical protein SMM66_002223 [Proteus mirabilis]|nr:hypothetical protein [Proteus mirabilis]